MNDILKVLVVMGSDSDYPVMEPCFSTLKKMGVDFDARVCSAHRTPRTAAQLASTAAEEGYGVIIGAAGLAAHLPGVLAAYTTLPVIGVPVSGGALKGQDALMAIVQMPPGIPVATVAIDGALNAAVLACQILALSNTDLQERLAAHKNEMEEGVAAKNRRLQDRLGEAGE